MLLSPPATASGPFEVESALPELKAAVTAVPDPAAGDELSDALMRELPDHAKRVTAPYQYPRMIEFVKELPKTVSGKIRRNQIRRQDEKKNARA